ncbi:MAG: RNA polymerase sigma factor [Candidatus Brocadiae bacterium]|nr:RNA polymerase sigma factor [Candidatus Brocadiia bacterium]
MQDPGVPKSVVLDAQAGDRDAFRTIVDAWGGPVFGLAWRYCFDRQEAEDLSQEIFLRLHAKLSLFDPSLPFAPWMYRLATNVCLNWKRGRGPRPASLDRMGPEEDGYEPEDPNDPALASSRRQEARESLARAMSGLPDEARTAIALRYEAGMEVTDVAKAMEVPVGTVKTWLFRARERLRAMLAPEWEVER